MSSTRRAPKRARIQRRAENDAMRTSRRDSLAVLLARLARGIAPTAAEVALLRAAVEAEIAEGDAARTSERGQQRAMEQQRQRVEAAEVAIVEAEKRAQDAEGHLAAYVDAFGPDAGDEYRAAQHRAEEAEQRLARIRDMADHWKRRLPDVIRTATAADAVRYAADGDDRPVMFDVTAGQAAVPVDECETPEGVPPVCTGPYWQERAAQAEAELNRSENAREALRDRAAQAEELQRIAHDISNTAEQARADAEQRLAKQQEMHDDRRIALADALDRTADATWPELVEAARQAQHEAMRAAVEDGHRQALAAALGDDRTTLWPALIQHVSAITAAYAQARTEQRHVEAADTAALNLASSSIKQWKERAEQAERSARAWEDTARTYATNMDDARHDRDTYRAAWHSARDRARRHARRADLADAVTTETKRLKERRTTTLRDRALRAERRIADTRRYVEAAYSADMCEGVREDLRRLLNGQPPEYGAPWNPRPEVITDRATIRDTLAEPEPAECPCPPSCACCPSTPADQPEPCRRHPMCTCDDCTPKTAAAERDEEPTR